MGQYGKVAVKAVELIKSGKVKKDKPREAWETAATEEIEAKSSREKSCPRCAFLGLYEEGKIKGIPPREPGEYTRSKESRRYALEAVSVLGEVPKLSQRKTKLWEKVKKRVGRENRNDEDEMDVVIALWNKNLIVRKT